ncbi:MAG: hypothetical protein KBC78_02460 [Candidatus Pacebacteria bacterium]|nr:hypothetical protein [Candidatus Paceibacterota bacterium]
MKKITLSLVITAISLFFAGSVFATGDGIQNGTSFKFPQQQSSGFKAGGDFWGGSDGIAKANGHGDNVDSGTFSAGAANGSFGSDFNGKKLEMKGDINVSQEAGAFNTAEGTNYAGSRTSSNIHGEGGMNGSGKVWSGKNHHGHNNDNDNDNDNHHNDNDHDDH